MTVSTSRWSEWQKIKIKKQYSSVLRFSITVMRESVDGIKLYFVSSNIILRATIKHSLLATAESVPA